MLFVITLPVARAAEMRALWNARKETFAFPSRAADATLEPVGVAGRRIMFMHDFDMNDAASLRDVVRLIYLADEMGLVLGEFLRRRPMPDWRYVAQTEPHLVRP